MLRIMHRVMLVAALAALALGITSVAASAAKKKSHKVKITQTGKPKGTRLIGPITSPQFGKGNGDGRLKNPNATYVWTFKKGKIYAHGVGTGQSGVTVTGTWKIDKGTGSYKGIKGGGKYKGSLATFVFTFTGSAKY
jgi:hypothetical protein